MSARLDERARAAISSERTPIFLATLNAEGRPNCVPDLTVLPYEDDKLIFGEYMMNKSHENLLANERVGMAVLSNALEAWSIKGEFLGFETQGERFDFMNSTPMFRYNAYAGVRAAGLIRIEDVSPRYRFAKPRLLLDFLRATALAPFMKPANVDGRCMPPQVEEKFRRFTAVRALAFRDTDGFPRAFPVLACLPAGANRLLVSDRLLDTYAGGIPDDGELAACVLTREAISYQVKGQYRGRRTGLSVIDLAECYSASPPLVDDRLDI